MAAIRKEIFVEVNSETVWDAIQDVGALHTRLVPGFVTNTELGDGFRIVTFNTGMILKELIVDINKTERRLVWSVVGEPFTHHNASLQVFEENGKSRAVWIADLLPNELKEPISELIEQGLKIMKNTLEAKI
jgi:carbon monoxide dehydrogenase subunit G